MGNEPRNDVHTTRRTKIEGLVLLVLILTAAFVSAPAANAQKSLTSEGKSHFAKLDGTRFIIRAMAKAGKRSS